MASPIPHGRRSTVLTSASRVGLTYLAVGVLWIVLSDTVLAAAVGDPETLSRIQTFKGWAFVAVSAALIWWLVRREVLRVHRSETWLSAFAEQGIAGVYIITGGRLVQANERLAHILRYPLDELIGTPVLDVVDEADRDQVTRTIRERESGQVDSAHYRFKGLRGDGTTVDLEVFGRAIVWEGAPAVAGLLLDITERVRLEEKLRQAARLDALGNLTGAVAHDFNNFLTGIIGNLDLMLSDPEGGPQDLRANLELVRDSAGRAAALTGQLLTFGRGRIFHHRPIDPNRHLRQLSTFLDSLCQGGQTLVLDLADDVPPVVLDPVALDQLVVNLFVNAKDAVGARGTITVRTRAVRGAEPPEVAVEVTDDGAGMSADVLERIFEPFFTTKERGTGLGLATVRSIVDEVRGHLAVESEAGAGTTVRVILPASDQEVPETPRAGALPLRRGTKGPGGATILVVDDDAAVRKVIAAALKRVGHHALVASTAAEAARLFEGVRGDVDLLVCDVNLADRSGPELVAALRAETPHLRVLFVSGARTPELVEHAALLRSSPFLEKPFSLDGLRLAVDAALDDEGGPFLEGTRI